MATTDGSTVEGPAEEITAAEGFSFIRGIATRGPDAYVLSDTGLYEISGSSLEATLVSSEVVGKLSIYGGQARSLVVSATHAYFGLAKGIGRVELASGTLETLYEEEDASNFVLTEALLYFGVITGDEPGIYSIPLAGGELPTLVTNAISPRGYDIFGGDVYGANANGRLVRQPLTGGSPIVVGGYTDGILPDVYAVRVSNGQAYWTESTGRDYVCALPECSSPMALNAYSSRSGFSIVGDRVYGIAGNTLGWRSTTGSGCGEYVTASRSLALGTMEVTTDYVYFDVSKNIYRLPL